LIFLGFFKPKMTALWLANQTRGVVALWKFKRKNPLELRATTPPVEKARMIRKNTGMQFPLPSA